MPASAGVPAHSLILNVLSEAPDFTLQLVIDAVPFELGAPPASGQAVSPALYRAIGIVLALCNNADGEAYLIDSSRNPVRLGPSIFPDSRYR